MATARGFSKQCAQGRGSGTPTASLNLREGLLDCYALLVSDSQFVPILLVSQYARRCGRHQNVFVRDVQRPLAELVGSRRFLVFLEDNSGTFASNDLVSSFADDPTVTLSTVRAGIIQLPRRKWQADWERLFVALQ